MTRRISIIYWLFLALVATAIVATGALAHEEGHQKYAQECCHELDCAPVLKTEIVPTQKFAQAGLGFLPKLKLPSQTLLTTKHGTAVVPEDLDPKAVYDSSDGQAHACMRCSTSAQGMNCKLVCWYKPPSL